MNKNKFLLLCVFINLFVFSQKQKSISVTYEYYANKALKYDTKLIVNSKFSKFINKHKSETFKMDWYELKFREIDVLSFYNFNSKEYTDNYLCEEEVFSSWKFDDKWTITNETKELLGYKVVKAVRKPIYQEAINSNIIVWFCPDLPFFSGPEYYIGLPGLVLQAGCPDDKAWGYYTAKKIKILKEEVLIKLIKRGKKVNRLNIRNCD